MPSLHFLDCQQLEADSLAVLVWVDEDEYGPWALCRLRLRILSNTV